MARKVARKSSRTPKKKGQKTKARKKPPQETWFGIVIDGVRTPFSLPSIEDAVVAAAGLREQGYKVAIYNQNTNRIVRRL